MLLAECELVVAGRCLGPAMNLICLSMQPAELPYGTFHPMYDKLVRCCWNHNGSEMDVKAFLVIEFLESKNLKETGYYFLNKQHHQGQMTTLPNQIAAGLYALHKK